MKPNVTASITDLLQAKFSGEETLWLTNTYTLRKIIGLLGMALPLLLFLFLLMSNGPTHPLESISHYYYTRVSGIFMGILTMLAIFLIIYKGKAPIDLIISCLAGVAALVVVFFPTGNITEICCDTSLPYSVTHLPNSRFRESLHYIAAAIFLGSLAYMSIFLFTKSNRTKHTCGVRKNQRNKIYKICGFLMVFALLFIFVAGFLKLLPEDFYAQHQLTFWMETLAVESFGISWLTKGEAWLKDLPEDKKD